MINRIRRNSTGISAGVDPGAMKEAMANMEARRTRVTALYVLLIVLLWATSFSLHGWTSARLSALEAHGGK